MDRTRIERHFIDDPDQTKPIVTPPRPERLNPLDPRLLLVRFGRRTWIVAVVVLLLVGSFTADAIASIGRIRSGVHVDSLDVGGLTREEASEQLTERSVLLLSEPVELFADTHRVSVSPTEISYQPDIEATAQAATDVGRTGNIFVRLWHRIRTLFANTDVGWRSTYDAESASAIAAEWARRLDTEGHEAGIEDEDGTLVAFGAVPGLKLDQRRAVETMVTGFGTWPRRSMELPIAVDERRTDIEDARRAAAIANEWVTEPITLIAPDDRRFRLTPERLASMIEAVPKQKGGDWELEVRFSAERVAEELGGDMKEYDTEPESASFVVLDGRITVQSGRKGEKFDAGATAKALGDTAQRSTRRELEAVFQQFDPELSTADAEALNIKELVSTFTTNHSCCQPRVENIHKMADAVDGAIVRPGESFSLNEHVGERTVEKGYLLAPMIYDGEYRDDVGGGVSQFATTTFNAVFFGAYEIDTYKAHSYYISRYPAGREATISWPRPDLKFTNNSRSGILIKTSYTSTSITVSLYGDKEGKEVRAESGARTNFTEFEEQRVENPELEKGEEKVVQEGAEGFDIVVWRIIEHDGHEERERFVTRYRPQPKIIEFGPGTQVSPSPSPGASASPAASATPAPTPTPTPAP